MRSDEAMHRTSSEAGASPSSPVSHEKRRLFGSALKKIRSVRDTKDDRRLHHVSSIDDSYDSNSLRPTETHASSISETFESSQRQLQMLIQRMRSIPSGPNHVDAGYKEFYKMKERCSGLCNAVLAEDLRPARSMSNATDAFSRRDSSIDSRHSPGAFDHRSSFSGRSLAEVITGSGGRSMHVSDSGLAAVREWKSCVEALADSFRVSLADTYKSYERDATPDMVEALFASKKFRREAVHRMRNASVTRLMSADPQFFPRYEIRFRNYEKVKQELNDIRQLLQAGESGISPARRIEEYSLSNRGDAVLEFANLSPDADGTEPVLRFRVASHMLADTSPIFARMFGGTGSSLELQDDEDITPHLPPPPSKYMFKDGSEAKLYRMPQLELNRLKSFEILLHAAHLHHEVVPREVSFEQLVAIAECSIRYKSTTALEPMVEHLWLPRWMHLGADDMPDGLLVISYAFGIRQMFTRTSMSAILNLVDERDLHTKPWPQKIKKMVWAIRCAKIEQVYACCTSAIQEYIRQPTRNAVELSDYVAPSELRNNNFSPIAPPKNPLSLSAPPRCPKGDASCDAVNLGWLMLLFNEMNILGRIMKPNLLTHLSVSPSSPQSLAQMLDALRRVPSPAAPIHRGGVCDPGPSFRAAINDIFNSVVGLTLFDISGKSHGWALSKHRRTDPQTLSNHGLNRMAAPKDQHSVSNEFPETVRLRIFSKIGDLDDLHAAAMVNRVFYDTYKTHELYLMRNILRADRIRSGKLRQPIPMSINNAEEKVRKDESDLIKEQPGVEGQDATTIRSEDDGEFSEIESDDETPAPSIHELVIRGQRIRGIGEAPSMDDEYIQVQRHRREDSESPSELADGLSTPTAASPVLSNGFGRNPRSNSTSSAKPSVESIEHIDEPPLTDEEARRILWGDDVDDDYSDRTPQSPPLRGFHARDASEKFRAGELSFGEALEAKTLVVTNEKQLRSEQDLAMGLIKKGRPETSGSRDEGSSQK